MRAHAVRPHPDVGALALEAGAGGGGSGRCTRDRGGCRERREVLATGAGWPERDLGVRTAPFSGRGSAGIRPRLRKPGPRRTSPAPSPSISTGRSARPLRSSSAWTSRSAASCARSSSAVCTASSASRASRTTWWSAWTSPREPPGGSCASRGRPRRWPHHVVYRSHEGPDDAWNLTTLCAWHHRRGEHDGLIRIRGRAPGELVFELPIGRFLSGDRLRPGRPVAASRAARLWARRSRRWARRT
jgi:hypothetical protein